MTEIDKTASIETLGELHSAVAKALKDRLSKDDFTAADLTAAINFLRANDIKAIRAKDTPLEQLGKTVQERGVVLPFEGGERKTA